MLLGTASLLHRALRGSTTVSHHYLHSTTRMAAAATAPAVAASAMAADALDQLEHDLARLELRSSAAPSSTTVSRTSAASPLPAASIKPAFRYTLPSPTPAPLPAAAPVTPSSRFARPPPRDSPAQRSGYQPFSTYAYAAADATLAASAAAAPSTPASASKPAGGNRSPSFSSPPSGNRYNRTPGSGPPRSPLTVHPYIAPTLRPDDAAGYRAAGLLAFRRTPDGSGTGVQFLLGREDGQWSSKKQGRLNLLGGKIEDLDCGSAVLTASREFVEESGALLGEPRDLAARVTEQGHGVHWYVSAKYALFLYEMRTPDEIGIVEAYSVSKAAAEAEGRQVVPEHTEMLGLVWADAADFMAYLADSNLTLTTACGGQYQLMNFTHAMLNTPCLRRKIGELVREFGNGSSDSKGDSQTLSPPILPNP